MSVFTLKQRMRLALSFRSATIPQIEEMIDILTKELKRKRSKLSKKVLKDIKNG